MAKIHSCSRRALVFYGRRRGIAFPTPIAKNVGRRRPGMALTAPVVALGLVLCACGTRATVATTKASDPTTQGPVVFQGTFSDPSQQWPTSSDTTPSESVSGDTYTVQFNSAGSFNASPTISTVQPQDLINVSVSVAATPSNATSGDRFGVLCRSIQGHSYSFSVGPSSSGQLAWSIQLRQPGGVRQLASGTTTAPGSTPYVIRGDCLGGGQNHKPVLLALYLGANLVGQAQDAKLPPPYLGQPGLSVSSTGGGTRVDFSNFQVRATSAS